MARRSLAFFGALFAVALFTCGCDGDERSASSETEDRANVPRGSQQARRTASVPARCDVGGRPDYYVPGHRPPALLGCARLGVSGKRVEFSGNLDDIDRELHLCVNPAYSGRGERGFYIPAICKLDPPPSRFAVRDAAQPRQGVRGYAFVVWGTATASTSDVVARFNGGTARAAVLKVQSKLARKFGERPFSLFVFELPIAAACAPVTVREVTSDATERIQRRAKLCERA